MVCRGNNKEDEDDQQQACSGKWGEEEAVGEEMSHPLV